MSDITIPPNVREHAKDRLFERYGLRLTVAEWSGVMSAIKNKTAMLIGRNFDGSEIWSVAVAGGTMIRVYYWPAPRDQIATVVLPTHKILTKGKNLNKETSKWSR